MAKAKRNLDHARISDFSDRDVMGMIRDLQANPGEAVSPRDIAVRAFGLRSDEEEEIKYLGKCVASRLAWMRRFGLTQTTGKMKWRLSPAGASLLNTRITGATERGIINAKDGASLSLAYVVGERYMAASDVAAKAMEREIRFQVNRRKRN